MATMKMEMIETIKADYERWKKADADWVDAMIVLAGHLADARKAYRNDRDFGAWLEKNGVNINDRDRAGLIHIGRNLQIKAAISNDCYEDARQQILATRTRSPQRIWKALENRVGHMTKPDSSKSKKAKKKTPLGRKSERQRTFAENLLVALRRKRKEAGEHAITRKWRPEGIQKLELIKALDWVERQLEAFINNRFDLLDFGSAKDKLRLVESAVDHVEENECGVRELNA